MSSSVKTIVRSYENYINGQWVRSSSGETFPVYDPSTEEVIAQVASGTAADVDSAVKAARAAFDSGPWRQTNAAERGRLLYKLAEKIRADAAACFEYYAGLANKVLGHVNPVPANALSFTLREPVGVAGQIIPWNYPL